MRSRRSLIAAVMSRSLAIAARTTARTSDWIAASNLTPALPAKAETLASRIDQAPEGGSPRGDSILHIKFVKTKYAHLAIAYRSISHHVSRSPPGLLAGQGPNKVDGSRADHTLPRHPPP